MEMLLVLLLLTYAEKDAGFKQRLQGVLSFYRENRDLLIALTEGGKRPAEADGGCAQSAGCGAQKNSPPAGGEDLHVLEEFLKKI